MAKKKDIEIRHEEVVEILQKMPAWGIRWGITVITAAVILLLIFSFFYRYPTLIRSEVVVSASNPPAELKARAEGKLMQLFVEDGQFVEAGKIVAVIENSASLEDVQLVEKALENKQSGEAFSKLEDLYKASSRLALGEVQSYFANYLKLLDDNNYFSRQDHYTEQIASMIGQIGMKQQLLDRLQNQKKLEKERYDLSLKSYVRDSQLHQQGINSEEDYEKAKSAYLNAGLEYETVRKELVETQTAIFSLQQQRSALEFEYENELKRLQTEINRSFEILNNEIDQWYLKYVLITPIEGRVSYNRVWARNQNVALGETVLTIVPELPDKIVGKAYVPVKGAGKVKPGQRVNIKLSNYPYMEYGMLIGKVARKAPVPVNNFYAVEIDLPNKFTTNYNVELEMQQELWGNCEIITEDLRLIQRIINPLKSLAKRNKR